MPTATAQPNTLGDVLNRCQGLMGDQTGRWVTQAYALPFIQTAYEDIESQIKNASGKNLEAVLEVLNVPTGTSSLAAFQKYGDPTANPATKNGPMVGLFDPIRLWVKSAGQMPANYTLAVGPRDTLPHVNPPGITPGTYATRVTFAWIGMNLSITPVAGPIDIQVYGRFNAPPLVNLTDRLVLYSKLTAALAYCTCALMGVERTNPAVLEGYASRGLAMLDNIVADIIRQSQREPRRLAKMGGQGGVSWGWS